MVAQAQVKEVTEVNVEVAKHQVTIIVRVELLEGFLDGHSSLDCALDLSKCFALLYLFFHVTLQLL